MHPPQSRRLTTSTTHIDFIPGLHGNELEWQ
jgi:hypothetical protein